MTKDAIQKVADLFPDLLRIHRRCPEDGLVVGDMANALVEAQHEDLALPLFERAARLAPRAVQIKKDFAEALATAGRYDDSARQWEIVAAMVPEEVEPRRRLARLLHVHLKRRAAAVSILEETLRQTGSPEDHQLLAECFVGDRSGGAAVARVQEALDGLGDPLSACQGVADALITYGRFEEAEAVVRFVIDNGRDNPTSLCTLALSLILQGMPERARPALEHALAVDPGNAWVILLTFCTLYSLSAYDESREFCLRSRDVWIGAHPPYTAEPWRGESLAGKRILLHHERHGFGDAIQFARLAAPLAERGARVFVAARHPIKALLACCRGVEKAVSKYDAPPDVDYECEAHLPWVLLPIGARELPDVVPSIPLDPGRVAARRARLKIPGCLSVGLAWEGTDARSWRPRTSASRSIPLVALRPIAAIEGVRLYSLLQRSSDLSTWNTLSAVSVVDVSHECRDFLCVAETIAALDVVIAVDTAAAHLAGAVGTRVCVLLPYAAEWRWERHRIDSPWYPSARLFRQRHPGVWSSVIDDVVQYLRTLIPQCEVAG